MFYFWLILSTLIVAIGLPLTIYFAKKAKQEITDTDEMKKRRSIGLFIGIFSGIILFVLIFYFMF